MEGIAYPYSFLDSLTSLLSLLTVDCRSPSTVDGVVRSLSIHLLILDCCWMVAFLCPLNLFLYLLICLLSFLCLCLYLWFGWVASSKQHRFPSVMDHGVMTSLMFSSCWTTCPSWYTWGSCLWFPCMECWRPCWATNDLVEHPRFEPAKFQLWFLGKLMTLFLIIFLDLGFELIE